VKGTRFLRPRVKGEEVYNKQRHEKPRGRIRAEGVRRDGIRGVTQKINRRPSWAPDIKNLIYGCHPLQSEDLQEIQIGLELDERMKRLGGVWRKHVNGKGFGDATS